MKKTFTLFAATFIFVFVHAQNISGILLDKQNGEPLIGATVSVKGTTNGTATDIDGKFELKITEKPPFTLLFSYIGYENQEIAINSADDLKRSFSIKMGTSEQILKTVEIVDTRITQKQQENPLTIESMGLSAIKQTASSTFYEGLGTLKGVDMTAASLGFVVINTRGFNSTSPVRSLQLLDGADNQAPGLNFSIGNFAGATEIDIQKVDLIVGASSPLYGPNAFNGVINLQTKNPFYYPGLTLYVKGAERNLFEGAFRYARVFKNKVGADKFAFKVNFSYLRANDWAANNMAAATDSWQPATNFGGYDAVNRYGDELPTKSSYNFDSYIGRRDNPGLGQIFRTGYKEQDVLNYNIRNLKANTALHYKITDKIEARVAYNYGTGTTVYQGDNRYSINGIQFHHLRAEIIQPDKFYIRAYTTMEDAGNSYDAVFTAYKIQDSYNDIRTWMANYQQFWNNGNIDSMIPGIKNRVIGLLGNSAPSFDLNINKPGLQNWWYPSTVTSDTSLWDEIFNQFSVDLSQQYDTLLLWQRIREYINRNYESILTQNQDSLRAWHDLARYYADNVPANGGKRIIPGTQEFNDSLRAITRRTAFEEGGTRFFDRSKMFHIQGEYKFEPKLKNREKPFMEILAGASFRMYFPDSRGTIFSDTITSYDVRNVNDGSTQTVSVNEFNALNKDSFEVVDFVRKRITNWEVGMYLSANKRFEFGAAKKHSIILTATVRVDKNQNFPFIATPAASVVWAYKNEHTVRLSFSSAVRNPTLQDQFLYYNVGRAVLIGNLNGVDSLVTIDSYRDYLGSNPYDTTLLNWFSVPKVRPERVQSLELGYKGIIAKKVYLDGSAYVSWYQYFLGFRIGGKIKNQGGIYNLQQVYRVAANSYDRIMTYGVSVGVNYYFIKNYAFNANYSWNKLNLLGSTDPIIPAFNTPEHKFNIGFSGKDIQIGKAKGFAFNVNYKWIQGFLFEGSPQFTGTIPSYMLLDAQISWEWQKIYTTFKFGGSNLISRLNFQTYGGPAIGRMLYGSILVNLDQDVLEKKREKKPKDF